MQMSDLENCIETCGREIYSFCCYLTRDRQEADDLYQDTFLKAAEITKRLDADANLKSALLSVAVNLWRNRCRKAAWRQRITGPLLSLDELSEGPDRWETGPPGADSTVPARDATSPLDILITREETQTVRRAVAALPDRYRIPVLLFYMEDMTIPEIAGILHIPQGTVKSRLHKAKKLLTPDLKEVLDET